MQTVETLWSNLTGSDTAMTMTTISLLIVFIFVTSVIGWGMKRKWYIVVPMLLGVYFVIWSTLAWLVPQFAGRTLLPDVVTPTPVEFFGTWPRVALLLSVMTGLVVYVWRTPGRKIWAVVLGSMGVTSTIIALSWAWSVREEFFASL